MNFKIVPGMLVCNSFLIRVYMFIVPKALLITSATVIVHAGGAICCVLYPCCVGVFCYVREKALLQCLQLLRGRWACMNPCRVFVGFWDKGLY